ncbi:MAG: helix-turn-helix domain-containing protein [Desulfomonilaceae bacterium]
MSTRKNIRATSGVSRLDALLEGLFIGDNVVWHDDAGSLASVFCMNFLKASQRSNKPVIYVTFDRSPRNLLEKLGALADYKKLIILDCFTWGKGEGSDVFARFYDEYAKTLACEVVRVDHPDQPSEVMEALYSQHSQFSGEVRFVFESITGMQEVWGGEDKVLHFYSHSCPRLYELNTIAYWILEKNAHSLRLRANINQIAQVAIELSIKRGTTSLTILKAEKRGPENLQRPVVYWTKGLSVTFEEDGGGAAQPWLGTKIREIRTKKKISQSELAKLVGVTPSTISQVEGNLIYPSLPALVKMAEVLSVDVGSFFGTRARPRRPVVFSSSDAVDLVLLDGREHGIRGKVLIPETQDTRSKLYLIEIAANTRLLSHFLFHKGEEAGYLISGLLHTTVGNETYRLMSGDVIYLTHETPSSWHNPGSETAVLLWIKINGA